ncbi:glycine-rich domain-containing protein 2 isoform X2 [Cryptomeria japonica]|uniref:glycine-rich domain-containing protein 2 isoform X2 n=1 Tax=Cryptomeria japonica TaxID=3369 RepID=UPI0025AD556D|nr:glycine-rich domain-containing protein 2 isoform X2 [Cryptomeria japonica]
MDAIQEEEWKKAQEISISVEIDLVSAAKRQLQFLASVDRNRCLYEGPALERAIFRYQHCWLPLLANHTYSNTAKFPLVAPLDCEWIWHCHRLNPVQYEKDCMKIYGKIVDASFAETSVKEFARKQTEEIWKNCHPEEPYELDLSQCDFDNSHRVAFQSFQKIEYDLMEAVRRQSSFFHQVSREHMSNDRFLKGAEERYKGFLYLIKKNGENSVNCFCVPTYDIDLMWHSHQLQPVAYRRDMLKMLGKVLEHDDMDSDRSQGKKLDVGFRETTRQWETTYGRRYWRAGAMYKGDAPSPLPFGPPPLENTVCIGEPLFQNDRKQQDNYLTRAEIVEVLLEVVSVRNIPKDQDGVLFVRYYKQRNCNEKRLVVDAKEIQISSLSKWKQLGTFRCEANGDLIFELISQSSSTLEKNKCFKVLGHVSISLHTLLDSPTFSLENWFPLSTDMQPNDSKPLSLHIALSVTPPIIAPYLLQADRLDPITRKKQILQLIRRTKQAKKMTRFLDHGKNEIFTVQTRTTKEPYVSSPEGSLKVLSDRRQIITVHQRTPNSDKLRTSDEPVAKAEELISGGETAHWSLMNNSCNLILRNVNDISREPIFELSGNLGHPLSLLSGRKLQYEVKGSKPEIEREFVTLVRYNPEAPFGQATSLFNWKSLVVEVAEKESVLLVVLLSAVISASLTKHQEPKSPSKGAKVNRKVQLLAG